MPEATAPPLTTQVTSHTRYLNHSKTVFSVSQVSNTSRCSVGTTFPWKDGIPWIICYVVHIPIRSDTSTSTLWKTQISRLISCILAAIVNNGLMTTARREVVNRKRDSSDVNSTFTCPCITRISLKSNQQEATFSWSIYFYKLLYIFQAFTPPIIRSTKLYIQRQVLSNNTAAYCYRSISSTTAAGSSIVWQYLTLFVLLMMGGVNTCNM